MREREGERDRAEPASGDGDGDGRTLVAPSELDQSPYLGCAKRMRMVDARVAMTGDDGWRLIGGDGWLNPGEARAVADAKTGSDSRVPKP